MFRPLLFIIGLRISVRGQSHNVRPWRNSFLFAIFSKSPVKYSKFMSKGLQKNSSRTGISLKDSMVKTRDNVSWQDLLREHL